MAELTSAAFDEFFTALWDKPPFAWQRELARRVLENRAAPWPAVIALPTASGKTACLDIAVFALAAAALNTPKHAPLPAARRIFFVVDRRVIVDEAFGRARKLAQALLKAETGVLKTVAEALRELGGEAEPLACFQLRGGMYRSDAWARSPAQPAIVASTVDQLGSRLLFRAYGRSHKAWPIQAGLAGNDALILLDEAHCAQPFLQTLSAMRDYRGWAETPLAAPFQAVVMSATPPPGSNDIFRDESDERRTPFHPLGDRQLAAKPARLVPPVKVKAATACEDLAAALAKAAEDLAKDRPPLASVIFVNRVATARAVFRRLEKNGRDAVLLTGRMRPFDKDDTVLGRLKDLQSANAAERRLEKPLFVVATQTLEVGADLDFDLLVTECASLDALRQRFGRLNRMGRAIEGRDGAGRPQGARAAVLVRADQAEKSDDDPVYDAALAHTWTWLKAQAGDSGELDFGIAALEPRLPEGEALAELNAPARSAPVMLPAHVDGWAQTAPEPMPSPEPALFLHGPGQASADVLVCWRADLDLSAVTGGDAEATEADKSLGILALCPPATAECLAVPIWRMRLWLAGIAAADDSGDVEGADEDFGDFKPQAGRRRVVRWRGREEAAVIECRSAFGAAEWGEITFGEGWNPLSDREALRPGDVVVIPAEVGGWQELGDLAPGREILDFGDRAYAASRGQALLRLHPDVMAYWPPERPAIERLKSLAGSAATRFDGDAEGFLVELRDALTELAGDWELRREWLWLRYVARGLAGEKPFKRCVELHPLGGLVLRGGECLPPLQPEDFEEHPEDSEEPLEFADRFSDEDDAASSSSTRAVLLSEHLQGVAGFARRFAEACRLPSPLAEAVTRAGLLHDLGKADPRFQALLRGGRPAPRGELLAKSGELPQGRAVHEHARKDAGYPKGARHELLSVRLAESAPGLLPEDEDLRDLVLHLVASHHGHCRPFAPVVFDRYPVAVSLRLDEPGELAGLDLQAFSDHGLERLDSGVAERFWRLTRRYGWWGLAWLEAILRLADHRRSEFETSKRAEP
jgi:CRISPR-associated endonuclease/helicase Cas3